MESMVRTISCSLVLALLVSGALCPAPASAGDATETINSGLQPILVKRPPFPYVAKGLKDATAVGISLKLSEETENQITDEDYWFKKNVLPRPPERIEEDFRYVPAETRWGELAFFKKSNRGDYVGIYAVTRTLDKPVDGVYDTARTYTAVKFDGGFTPTRLFVLEEIHTGILEVSSLAVVDDVLYFDCNYNGYASILGRETGYLLALDMETGKFLWTSAALTASYRGFVVFKDVIFAGYGFTDEPDFLFVLNRHTGKVLQKIKLRSAHSYFIPKDDVLHVRTYDTDYKFRIVESKPRR
jgi:hypothetical protein